MQESVEIGRSGPELSFNLWEELEEQLVRRDGMELRFGFVLCGFFDGGESLIETGISFVECLGVGFQRVGPEGKSESLPRALGGDDLPQLF